MVLKVEESPDRNTDFELFIDGEFDSTTSLFEYRQADNVGVTTGKFKRTPAFEGKIAEFLLFGFPFSKQDVRERYLEGLDDIEAGAWQEQERVKEALRLEANKGEFAKTKGLNSDTLGAFGVPSTFYKPEKDEESLTNHAPPEPTEVPSEVIQRVEAFLVQNPELYALVDDILESRSWIIKAASILSTGEVKKDGALEARRFKRVLAAANINVSLKLVVALSDAAKARVEVPTEDDKMVSGVLYWELIQALKRVAPSPYEDEQEAQALSVGAYTDSDEFSEPEEEKPATPEPEPKE